jgi:hypothetical protein
MSDETADQLADVLVEYRGADQALISSEYLPRAAALLSVAVADIPYDADDLMDLVLEYRDVMRALLALLRDRAEAD